MTNLSNYDIDESIRAEFIDESLDGLSEMSELFIELEMDPSNKPLIEKIFRVAHSIKGSSAYFGMLKTKDLAHKMENVLDNIRKGNLVPSQNITDLLLNGSDMLIEIMERVRNNEPEITDEEIYKELIENISNSAQSVKLSEELLWKQVIDNLNENKSKTLNSNEISTILLKLYDSTIELAGKYSEGQKALTTLSIGGKIPENIPSQFNDLNMLLESDNEYELDINESEQIHKLLEELRDVIADENAGKIINECLDDYKLFMNSIGLDPIARESISDKIRDLSKMDIWSVKDQKTEIPSESPEPEEKEGKEGTKEVKSSKEKQTTDDNSAKTMRVSERSIDDFLENVGDLISINERYDNLSTQLQDEKNVYRAITDLKRINKNFSDLSNKLQKSVMEIRLVPLKPLLQRVPRIIRDIAKSTEKEIDIQIVGEDIAIDKSLIDTLEAPLIHMARNSADHGIEMPDEREKNGKTRKGLVEVIVSETPDFLFLTVKDDGAGLNYDALTKKAVSLGIIKEGIKLSEQEVINILFQSGVTTAKEVTDVSGRGVGMDVVKRSIDKRGGDISVKSEPNKGSEFKIKMPKAVTTQILTGFVVLSGKTHYILPMENIIKSFSPDQEEIYSVRDKGQCVKYNDQIIPIYDFKYHTTNTKLKSNFAKGIFIIIKSQGKQVSLHIDKIINVRQVVLKDICLTKNIDIFRGGAIMGNGEVAMVIDVDKLIYNFLNNEIN